MANTDEALVQAARDGDRAAFEELVRRTSRLVFARLYLETGDSHRAEDLLQETYLIAFRSVRRLTDPAGFRAWLLRIAQNVAIDAVRREHRQKRTAPASLPLERVDGSATARSPEHEVEKDEVRNRVLSALRSLPEHYQLPLTLRYLSGADYEAISTQLALTNGSLRGLLHRGLNLLRAKLEESLGKDFFEER